LPHEEKLLDVNAALLRLYVHAADVLREERYRDRAASILQYVSIWLADPEGGWWGSQCADHEYYACRSVEARRRRPAPAVDLTLYSGWNGAMVSAALQAAQLLGDTTAAESAIAALERILGACYAPAGGVAHYFDGSAQIRGLLDDQIAMVDAALEAYDVTGNITYEMVAEELGHYALRTMWDEEQGGFRDREPPRAEERIGLLRADLKPFVSNCEAARVLLRLAAASGHHEFGDKARAALALVNPLAAGRGPDAAHYLLALHAAGVR
jgi:hypothetical protein